VRESQYSERPTDQHNHLPFSPDFGPHIRHLAMIDPGVRYLSPGMLGVGPPPMAPDLTVEAAVDLSKKRDTRLDRESDHQYVSRWMQEDDRRAEEPEDSDSDTPLDMSVTATRLSPGPVFPGFIRDRSQSPGGMSDRSESMLVRLQAGLYSPVGSMQSRGWSAERSEADRDEFPRGDGCHICGMPRSEMSSYEHGEGVCNQRPISCQLCTKTFTLWSHYEAHKKCHQKLKQRQYPCKSCGKIFTSASNRNMHQRIHMGVRPFHCVPCGVYFRQKAHLQKHQRTQGHIQATELYDKRKTEENILRGEAASSLMSLAGDTKDLDMDSHSEPRSEDSLPPVDSSTSGSVSPSGEIGEDLKISLEALRASPKRKQSHPQYSPQHMREDSLSPEQENDREAQICHNIEYNSLTHGYDCRQCDFSSHDHALMKEHVQEDHLRTVADLQCKECMVTFTKPFNLKIHLRKHETSSQFLPCEYCEQVFKVPNKLIKHMEGVHCVCPTCGHKNNDKVSLQEHMEKSHNEPRKVPLLTNAVQDIQGSQVLGQLRIRQSIQQIQPTQDLENRHAKMRKLDSLAEHIRAKQLQLTHTHTATNLVNGNTGKMGIESSMEALRRKSEMPSVRALLDKRPLDQYFRPGLENIVNQLNRMNSNQAVLKSENNNILSSISKMTELPHHNHKFIKTEREDHHYEDSHAAALDFTPPVSPPNEDNDSSYHINHHNETDDVIINNNTTIKSEPDAEETGLDLTVKRDIVQKSEENEVTTTATESESSDEQIYPSNNMIPPPFPYIVPNLPFLARMPLSQIPHPNPSFTEHLFKLANITRPPPPSSGQAQDLSKPTPIPAQPQPSVLTGIIATSIPSIPRPVGHSPIFPVFPGGLPASMFPQHPIPLGNEERPSSPSSLSGNGLESKPFRCTYCPKEFGHLSSLESHVERLHTNESKHNCETCGKAFSSKSNLTAHKKIHSGERPFKCPVCHKTFRQKAHLQKHETTHSSATPYQCPHCDKAFGHPSNLNTHIATHSDIRPYECQDCGKAYKDSASFKRHRMVHTGERPYPCVHCGESFIDSKSLRRHRETQHPSAVPDPELENFDEEEEEYIEPGQEEEYHHGDTLENEDPDEAEDIQEVKEERGESDDEGIPADGIEDHDDDSDSVEGNLEIADITADSGLNSSLDISCQ